MKCYSDSFMSEKNLSSPVRIIPSMLHVYLNLITNIILISRTDGKNLINLKQRNLLWTPENLRDKITFAFMALCWLITSDSLRLFPFISVKKGLCKGKQFPYRPGQTLKVPGGWGSRISRQSAHEGSKVVRPTHRPPLPHQEIYLVLIYIRDWVVPMSIVQPEGLCQQKISNDIIGNQTRDLSVYTAVPQPSALPRAPKELCNVE